VDALRAIAAAAYQKYVPRIGRAPAPMTADYAQAVRGRQAWAAIQDKQIVGFAVLIAKPGHLLLENVAVLPAVQGRGTADCSASPKITPAALASAKSGSTPTRP
jgi:hypothetical protein